jgi:FKBP-type peptidyl-prolyl cis-trans isomerase 2
MSVAKSNDAVKVHYTGKLSTGEVFDSSIEREPIEFTIGAGMMIKGFDDAVNGMTVNEKKTINITPEDAYGPVRPELMQQVPKEQLPTDMAPEVGQTLVAQGQDGRETHVVIAQVEEAHIIVDANHPLAGKDLVFDIELVEIATA